MATDRSSQRGVSLLEVLIAMLLLSSVALSHGVLLRSLGLLGVSQFSSARYERPARVRTLSMEYMQAEMEYLRNRSYMEIRDAAACNPSPGLPVSLASARRVPTTYVDANEPRLPSLLAAADILLANEPVAGVAPDGCAPRRISVVVYFQGLDVPASIGGSGGVIFMRAETVRSLR